LSFVDDCILIAKEKQTIDDMIKDLSNDYSITDEGTLATYLGIQFDKLPDGSYNAVQSGLKGKALEAAEMSDCKPCSTPASPIPVGSDDDGDPFNESWSYASIVGMLQYLQQNTRPDISFAVNQAARFTHAPKASHARAVKQILRYLKGIKDKGMIYRPTGELALDCFVDADFGGLYGHKSPRTP
jgi:hypothetical protein